MTTDLVKCSRCEREAETTDEWSVTYLNGRPQFYTCPECLTQRTTRSLLGTMT